MSSDWYVYLLRDADGHVRYVGKGCGERMQTSAYERRMRWEIAISGLDEYEALRTEARLIHLIGPERLENIRIPWWPRADTAYLHASNKPRSKWMRYGAQRSSRPLSWFMAEVAAEMDRRLAAKANADG